MQEFLDYQKEITDVQHTVKLLSWELRINAPVNAQNDIIDLISIHEMKLFELQTSDNYGILLNNAITSPEYNLLDESEKRYISNLYKNYEKFKKIPSEFYEEYSKMKNVTTLVWSEAKEKNNYKIYEPYLEKIIELTKQYYIYMSGSSDNLYDFMLNEYETGFTSEIIDKLFLELKEGIIDLIPNKLFDNTKSNFNFTEQQLKECANYILNYMGFDLNRGTIGICSHDYTDKMNPNDIRIAFKKVSNPADFVSTIIHEGGHGIYEQNIAPNLSRYENSTISNCFALHESQSRFYENMLGRNKNFWIPIYEECKKILNIDYTIDEFVLSLNTPECNPIRVMADELTYCMHIILRYEIERDIFNGKITVSEIPEIWNKKSKDYLNIEVKNDSEGLMQDAHWADGDFGYFPSYLLGSIYDGMFYEQIEKELGSIDLLLKNNEIKEITKYLTDNIYVHGGAYTSLEIIDRMCNKEISVKPLIKYFKNKYGK